MFCIGDWITLKFALFYFVFISVVPVPFEALRFDIDHLKAPFYRDPVFDSPADPFAIYDRTRKVTYMFI